MFTASLNLEALQQAAQGSHRTCAAEGCEQPLPQTAQPNAEYCPEHSQQRAKPRRRSKKARR
jgi:hypothetical protein